jgi:hypothetical protein
MGGGRKAYGERRCSWRVLAVKPERKTPFRVCGSVHLQILILRLIVASDCVLYLKKDITWKTKA